MTPSFHGALLHPDGWNRPPSKKGLHNKTTQKRLSPDPGDERNQGLHPFKRCLAELPEGTSPRDWVRLEVGWTDLGLEVWCIRHEINVIHVDFEGATHPANTGVRNEH